MDNITTTEDVQKASRALQSLCLSDENRADLKNELTSFQDNRTGTTSQAAKTPTQDAEDALKHFERLERAVRLATRCTYSSTNDAVNKLGNSKWNERMQSITEQLAKTHRDIDELAGDIFAVEKEAVKNREKQKVEQNTMCCNDCVEQPTAPRTATPANEEPRKLLPRIVFRPGAKWPADLEVARK